MKQTFVRIATAAAFAGVALGAGSAAWAQSAAGCPAAQAGTPPKAEAQCPGQQGQGMRGMGMGGMGMGMAMGGNQAAMAERMARMHGDGAARPGQPGAAMPCRDGTGPRCPLAQPEEHKH